jgi:hypothetical protein
MNMEHTRITPELNRSKSIVLKNKNWAVYTL